MTNTPHARAFDLPGWPCPPRVRDIPNHENSWGLIDVTQTSPSIAQDELGCLWVNGDVIPKFDMPYETNASPGALLFSAPTGIGLWMHPKSMRYLPSVSRLDMTPGQWLPVNEVAAEWPPFVKESS